jgi:predicted alpha/beta hydrolase family esterase
MPHITFIHGIANKPPHDQLLDLWIRSLAEGTGVDLGAEGVTSTMVYWADMMYPEPAAEVEAESAGDEAVAEAKSPESPDLEVEDMDASEAAWTAGLAAKLAVPLAVDEVVTAAIAVTPSPVAETLERIPLPGPIKVRLMKRLLRDVHHYLYNVDYSPRPGATFKVQDDIRARMIKALKEGAEKPGPHVVVSHSMGTVIAYDCLKRVADAPVVDGFMTIGSPLGLDEVQDKLRPEWSRDNGFPFEKVRGRWVNVYDKLDPVAGFDPNFANDFRRNSQSKVEDINEQNYGSWRHDISKYMRGPRLRQALRELLDL